MHRLAELASGEMRIAIVIPWFGRDLKGGAEQQAWQLSTRLAARGHTVDVLTTCCRSFHDDWGTNHLPASEERLEGLTVRRFPVDRRNRSAFDMLNSHLLAIPRPELHAGISPIPSERARIWTEENINSRELEKFIAANASRYDALVFIPYLYGPTLRIVPNVDGKAWMQPCLHDEVYAYLPDVARAIHAARGLLFLSAGEQDAAVRLFGPSVWSKGHLVGAGIEFGALDAHRGADLPEGLESGRFLLYLGRREAGKGADLLVCAFKAWRTQLQDDGVKLILAGAGAGNYSDEGGNIVDLGLVSDESRAALLWNCLAIMIPSPNESFSRVLFEGWYCGRPALVRESCGATRLAVEQSGGGWVAETQAEWTQRIATIIGSEPEALAAAGLAGRQYAKRTAEWDAVVETCERILSGKDKRSEWMRNRDRHPEAIHQLSPNLAPGDAISAEMLAIRERLRAAGYRSEIFARFVDRGMERHGKTYSADALEPEDGLIYHHSIGSEVTTAAIEHPGPKGLVYHNITPVEFFRPFRPEFARILRDGREDLWRLARSFRTSAGDSRFNAEELARYGFAQPGILPLTVDPIAWDSPPNPAWMERLSDGRINILFVGRVAPNKRQDRLVNAFSFLRANTNARLILAGAAPEGDPYGELVRGRVAELGLEEDVVIAGRCESPDLHAFFRCSHVYWSFSEHEGFGVPLIEAMWFDVPVVALASSAVPETLDGAGMTFRWEEADIVVAAKVREVLFDETARARILAAQRARRRDFATAATEAPLADFIERVASTPIAPPTAAHG